MGLTLVRNDITKMDCDAVVSSAAPDLSPTGGVSLALSLAAGEDYDWECREKGPCATGGAVVTGGYRLPAGYVIHTVSPVWEGGLLGEEVLLRSCYRSALQLAKEHSFRSMAFPLLGTGAYGYPKEDALRVAREEIGAFLSENDMDIYIVIFDEESFRIGKALERDIAEYIDKNYALSYANERRRGTISKRRFRRDSEISDCALYEDESPCLSSANISEPDFFTVDEGFSDTLLRLIDRSGMSDSECYRKANIDRKLFSKIRSNPSYHPGKQTVIALCIALELSLKDTEKLLMKAGYALSDSYLSDVIVRYFIENGKYDLYRINEVLFRYDQSLIGG